MTAVHPGETLERRAGETRVYSFGAEWHRGTVTHVVVTLKGEDTVQVEPVTVIERGVKVDAVKVWGGQPGGKYQLERVVSTKAGDVLQQWVRERVVA